MQQCHWVLKDPRWSGSMRTNQKIGIGIAIGAGAGVGIGALFGNVGVGVAIGVALTAGWCRLGKEG